MNQETKIIKRKTYSISMPKTYQEYLDHWSKTTGLSISEIVRRLIDHYKVTYDLKLKELQEKANETI